jgi:WD40 repeat protein
MQGHRRPVWSVAFSADGRRGLSAGYDEVVKIWDLATGEEIPAPR